MPNSIPWTFAHNGQPERLIGVDDAGVDAEVEPDAQKQRRRMETAKSVTQRPISFMP